MTLAIEKQDFAKVYDKQTEGWKMIKKDPLCNSQLSTIEETLTRFGLLKNEIKVFLHLAGAGEMKAGDIAGAISLHRTETYRILRDLEKKGIVFSIFGKPLKFMAVSLGEAVDSLIDAQKIQIKLLEQEKPNLMELWQAMPRTQTKTTKKELFQMLEGEKQVLMKANELVERAEKEFLVFASADYLAQLYYNDFSDKLKNQSSKIKIMLVTDNSQKSAYFLGQMKWLCNSRQISDEQSLPSFMIRDDKEILITFHEKDRSSDGNVKKKDKTAAIWTNYSAFIKVLVMLFSKLSVDKAKIAS